MKLMRHHYLAISVTLITCASMGEMSISQAGEYAQNYSGSDRSSRSQDNVWRSGTTFNNIRRARFEREGAMDNPWQANNNFRFDKPHSRKRGGQQSWNNRPEDDGRYERRSRYEDRDSRFYDRKSRYEKSRYPAKRYRDRDYQYTRYRDSYDLPRYSYDRTDSMYGYELEPDYGSPLMTPSLSSGLLYGADPYRASAYGLYPYPGQGGFRPW